MANEVELFELSVAPGGLPVRAWPPIAKQTLSIAGATSAAFNRSTSIVTIIATTVCRVEFSARDGTDPTGSGVNIPLAANVPYDFAVVSGRKAKVIAA